MSVIFSGQPGRVVALQDPGVPLTARLATLDNGDFGFQQYRAILTRVFVARQGNFQFLHTLGDEIFLYTFGERIGQVRLSGVAFTADCAGANSTGLERVLDYYDQNRIANRETPIKVTIGTNTTLVGYLGQMQIDSGDPALPIAIFELPLILVPES